MDKLGFVGVFANNILFAILVVGTGVLDCPL